MNMAELPLESNELVHTLGRMLSRDEKCAIIDARGGPRAVRGHAAIGPKCRQNPLGEGAVADRANQCLTKVLAHRA
jgi:hypothetical protein